MKRATGLAWLGTVACGLALAGCGGGNNGSSSSGGGLQGQPTFGITSNGQLIRFGTGNPNRPDQTVTLTGLQPGETIRGIDTRPADGSLFALGSSSRLYRINPTSGVASAVGGPFSLPLNGTSFGFDFNPTVDRIRIVSDADQNLRVNPDTGAVVDADANPVNGIQPDTPLSYVAGDAAQGQNPNVTAVAYTNNVAGAATTTLFGIDTTRNTLVRFAAPNAGTLQTVGALGIDVDSVASFDIQGGTGDAFAALRVGGETSLYRINLDSGAATRVNRIDTGTATILAISLDS